MELEISQAGYKVEHKKNTKDNVFSDFQKISDHFPKIFEDSPNVVRRPHKRFRFRNVRRLPKISEDNRGLPKTSQEVPKMFRSSIQLIIIESSQ